MDLPNIKASAHRTLNSAAFDPKALAAIHTGAALALSLLLTVCNFLLTGNMDAATGLSQMNSRALLGTVQSVLSLAASLALPFWEIGFLGATLRNVRSADAMPRDLLSGFHRFGGVLRLYLLQFGMYLLVATACLQVSSLLFSFTPFWQDMMAEAQALLDTAAANGQVSLSPQDIATLLPSMVPMYIIMLVLMGIVAIPLFYRFRMAFYALMDDTPSALAAMRASARIMRNKRMTLFRLDLQFWWFYAAQLLIAVIAYLDLLLPAVGVQLPVSEDAFFFITYSVHLVLQLLVAWQFTSRVQTTYAVCYDHWKTDAATAEKPQLPETQA